MNRKELWQNMANLVEQGWYLIACDLGHPHLEALQILYPDRVINVGVAEQAAVGIATGLALAGKRVMVYGIGNQVVMRAYEQLFYAQINHAHITIIGVGHGGYYRNAGISHDADILDKMGALQTLSLHKTDTTRFFANMHQYANLFYIACK